MTFNLVVVDKVEHLIGCPKRNGPNSIERIAAVYLGPLKASSSTTCSRKTST